MLRATIQWMVFIALCGWVSISFAEEVVVTEQARQHFKVGVNLLEDPDGPRYEEAYQAFKLAYAESPSPKMLHNLGLCAMMLERDAEAIDAYTRYLKEVSSIAPDIRKQIETDLETLKAGIGKVRFTIEPSGTILVDERTPVRGAHISNRYGPLGGYVELALRAGVHKIEARADGYVSANIDFELKAGETLERRIVLQLPKKDAPENTVRASRPVPTSVWIGAGTTALFAMAAGVTGVMTLSKTDEYNQLNTGHSYDEAATARDEAATFNTVTDVLLGATLIAGIGTIVLYATRPTATEATANVIHMQPIVHPEHGGLMIEGRF